MRKPLTLSLGLNVLFLVSLIVAGVVAFSQGWLPISNSSNFDSVRSGGPVGSLDPKTLKFETIADNLKVPWSVAVIDSSTLLVTERPGRVNLVRGGVKKVVLELKDTLAVSESGLMGITLDPEFSKNKFVYLMYAFTDGEGQGIRVVRYTLQGDFLTERRTILGDIPVRRNHSGGELAFGPDGKLYITTGENFDRDLAQDLSSLAGKILRINSNGTVPQDNPFVNRAGARGEIWTWGHRNPQGIDWHPVTFEMYSAEHGPSGSDGGTGMDEINLIKRGLNYGWPIIRGEERQSGLVTPIKQYTPAIAPSSVLFYDGDMFPELRNKLLVANLRGTSILALELDGNELKSEQVLVDDRFGRIRDLAQGIDGEIFFTTSNTDGRGQVQDKDDKVIKLWR